MRSSPPLWPWLLLPLVVLLLPGEARRLLLDLLGGITLALLLLPLLGAGLVFLAWRLLRSRLRTCGACGLSSLGGGDACPACGTPYATDGAPEALSDARHATINVEAVDVSDDPKSGTPGHPSPPGR